MGLDPTNPDSDSDTLKDGAEIVGAGARGATYPTDADSDDDALTDGQESSSGIDGTKTHTHAISGGGAAAINNGDWVPSLGGVTGPGLLDLFGGFTYSGTGADSGASQTFTLSGLTPGQGYLLRLYVRLRDTEGSGRATDLSFTNGTQTDYVPLLEDRPAIMLGDPAATHAAYAVEYPYIAAGTELVINSGVPLGSQSPNGSLHLYGLTNEIGGPPKLPVITAVSYDPTVPKFSITFDSQPGVSYALDFATTLESAGNPGGWAELSDSILSQGTTTTFENAIVPPSFAGAFYRLRLLP